MHSVRLAETTRTRLHKAVTWLLTCAAVAAVSRSLVHDFELRMGAALAPPPPQRAEWLLPAQAIVPPPLPPRTGLDELLIPVPGVQPTMLVDTFTARRSGGRMHEALDILAKRNTPVIATNDGTVVDMSTSSLGGITLYQLDPTGEYAYYYAHLQRYAHGIREGQRVVKGQVLGYVGTTGNAPPNMPHLHFAIFRLKSAGQWHEGDPIDPYKVLADRSFRPQFAQQCSFKGNQTSGPDEQRHSEANC